MISSIYLMDIIFSLMVICLPLLLGLWHASYNQEKKIEYILLYYIFIGIGIQALASGMMQAFFSDSVTHYVNWPYSPFMVELGLANLSYGLLGLLSPWMSRGWRKATAAGYGLFLCFTGMRHIVDMMANGINKGNSGPFMYVDLILGFIFLMLLFLQSPEEKI